MRRKMGAPGLAWALLPLIMASTTHAAEPAEFSDEAPIELARYVTGGATLLDAAPAGFPLLPWPEELRVVGAAVAGERQTLVLQGPDDAGQHAAALRDALLAEPGWLLLDRWNGAGMVFEPAGTPAEPFGLCHDEVGLLDIREMADALTLSLAPLRPTDPRCEARRRNLSRQSSAPLFNMAGLRLRVPEGSRLLDSSGSGGAYRSLEAELSAGTESLSSLAEHFAEQLRAQGWTEEAAWQGARSAGGRWNWMSAEGGTLSGQLEIVQRSSESFALRFGFNAGDFSPR